VSRKDDANRPSSPRSRSTFRLYGGLFAGLALGLLLSAQIPPGVFNRPSISASLLSEPGLIERTVGFAPVIAFARPELLEPLRERIEAMEPGRQNADLLLFGDWWARFDPEATDRWAKAYEDRHGLSVRPGVFRAWARRDPYVALEQAEKSSTWGDEQAVWQNPNVSAVMKGWDESGRPGLRQWIFESDEIDRQALMQIWARERAAMMAPDAVWDWAERFPGTMRKEMLPAVAAALAARRPADAVRLATPYLEAGDTLGLLQRISTRWVKREPRATMDWISTTPEGRMRDNAVLEAARNWNTRDRKGFARYMEEHLDDFPEWLEPAFELYSRSLAADGSPVSGLAIAQRLRKQSRRDYNTTKILRHWLLLDRPAARSWIEDNGVRSVFRGSRLVISSS